MLVTMATDFARRFGLQLRRARKEASITLDRMAEQLEVSRSAITHWEAGRNLPELARMPEISEVTGKSIGWFFGDELPTDYLEQFSPAQRKLLETMLRAALEEASDAD